MDAAPPGVQAGSAESEPKFGSGAELLVLPGALTIFFSFNAGGFFTSPPALAAVTLALLLALRAAFSAHPFQAMSKPLAVAVGALGLFVGWTLLSAVWSDSLGRALLEFDRALVYLLALVVCGSVPRTSASMRWMLRGVAVGMVVPCLVGLVSRTLPELYSISPAHATARLSYPLTYWNALGLLAALGLIFCFHLATDEAEPLPARLLASAAIPLTATTLLLTFSRGAVAAGAVGLVAYAVLARPAGLLPGLLALAPPTAISVVVAYQAESLAVPGPASRLAIAQGQRLALVVGVCTMGAALLRWAMSKGVAERRLLSARRAVTVATVVVGVSAGLAVALTLDAPRQPQGPDPAAQAPDVQQGGQQRAHLTEADSPARFAQWGVALRAFQDRPLTGQGAGTYALQWAEHRPVRFARAGALDGHSLYLEVLGELGVVGLVLLAVVLVFIGVGLAVQVRESQRAAYAALLAATTAWALHAAFDWDWEMPAVTAWLFAAGGAALARPARSDGAGARLKWMPLLRVGVVVACVAVAVLPARVVMAEAHLSRSLLAFQRADCPGAVDAARSSASALGARPDPLEILGYCLVSQGSGEQGLHWLEEAVERDPRNWRFRYDLALARGAARLDPRPDALAALGLNPLGALPMQAVRRFETEDPAQWRAAASTAPILLPGPRTLAAVQAAANRPGA